MTFCLAKANNSCQGHSNKENNIKPKMKMCFKSDFHHINTASVFNVRENLTIYKKIRILLQYSSIV